MREPLTVSALNALVRRTLEYEIPTAQVVGEISNFVRAGSGHWYFSLKDEQAQVRCAMFRQRNALLSFDVRNGLQVELHAQVTLYEPRGDCQLIVEAMRPAGQGALFEAFQRLKQKLSAEGLFDQKRKRPLPPFSRRVGIVTSLQAAALRDVLRTLQQRAPAVEVVIYPCVVQGQSAAAQLVGALQEAGRRNEVDVLFVCRGGGSLEDLWPFNDEQLARALRSMPIPVISGVGHETDFTIADFAADYRAATPTAAAHASVPDHRALAQRLATLGNRLQSGWLQQARQRQLRLDAAQIQVVHPRARMVQQRHRLEELLRMAGNLQRWHFDRASERLLMLTRHLERIVGRGTEHAARLKSAGKRLHRALHDTLQSREIAVERAARSLIHLAPQAILERGYAIVRKSGDKNAVRDVGQLELHARIEIQFARGTVSADVVTLGPSEPTSGSQLEPQA